MCKQFKDLFVINNMSLEYYLLSKKKYERIMEHLESVIEKFEDIFSYTAEFDMDEAESILDIFNPRSHSDYIRCKLNCVCQLKHICERKIKQLCVHEFVNDTIDIDPDRSQNITYCKICEYTVPN
jgi:hypothetical protein